MGLSPPVETPSAQVSTIEHGDPAEAYWIYVLSRIDAPDIPQNVKQFAKDNNCVALMKDYHWSNVKYRGFNFRGVDVYTCNKNKKINIFWSKMIISVFPIGFKDTSSIK